MSEFLIQYSPEISLFIRAASCVLIAFFCLPLQIREAKVKNGLRILRYQLLAFGLILLFTNFISMAFLLDAAMSPIDQKPLNASLQYINALAFFALAFIGHSIYRFQYTEEQKEFHEKVAVEENKADAKITTRSMIPTVDC